MHKRNLTLTALVLAGIVTGCLWLLPQLYPTCLGWVYFPSVITSVILSRLASGGWHSTPAALDISSFVAWTIVYWVVFLVIYVILLEIYLIRRVLHHLEHVQPLLTAKVPNPASALETTGQAIAELETRRRRHLLLKPYPIIDLSESPGLLAARALTQATRPRPVARLIKRLRSKVASEAGAPAAVQAEDLLKKCATESMAEPKTRPQAGSAAGAARRGPSALAAPVHYLPMDDASQPLRPGMGLCLSGGGYRAMLFHLGVIIRLNEAGILAKLRRISSVSGGSITAGVLGSSWKRLTFGGGVASNLEAEVVAPVREIASRTIDVPAVLLGVLLPGSVSDRIEAAYDKILFHGATLQDLPSDNEGPRFVINAANLQTGALFRFSRPFMADWRIGVIKSPRVPIAKAVAASSAFPPVLSPCLLKVKFADFEAEGRGSLFRFPYNAEVVLADGGVYDNMGIETVWKDYQTVLVSDAGKSLTPEGEPKRDWLLQSVRVLDVIDNQVGSLRKRQIIAAFKNPEDGHDGTYWSVGSHVKDYGLRDPIIPATDFQPPSLVELAQTPTRLQQLEPRYQERLINWGYAISDTAIRAHVDKTIPKGSIPYPNSPISTVLL